MNAIWINIIIAIIQIIAMFAIGYWQISVAKSIAKDEIGTKANFKTRLRNFLSKHSSKIVNFFIFINIFIIAQFLYLEQAPTRLEIFKLVFFIVSTLFLCMLHVFQLVLDLIKTSHKLLYCMICKRSTDPKRPACIENIEKEIDKTET